MNKTTYRLQMEYDGTSYYGWQRQPDVISIQEALEDAVEELFQERVKVQGAGRTDAGVHALNMTAHFRVRKHRPCDTVRSALNDYLPDDVSILNVREADSSFHARFDAVGKMYRYFLYTRSIPSVFWKRYAWWIPERLELDPMKEASDTLLGEQDFASFASEVESDENSTCTIYRIDWWSRADVIRFTVFGDRFLYKMVRTIVGTLVEIGKGNIDADEMSEIISAQDIRAAGPVAPASGLQLVHVYYEKDGRIFDIN